MAGNTIQISVLANTGNASKGLDSLAAKLDRIGGRFSKAGNVVGVAAGAIVGGLAATIKPASDLQQMVGGVQAVFGKYADGVIKDSKRAADAVGLSATEYDQFATLLGAQLKNAGTPMDELGGKTKNLISLGADLAATFGGTTSEAVDALSSAMKGEMDPIEKYGISLNQSMLQQQATAMGISANSSSWTNAQKQQVILAALTKQSTDAQGQFARESDTVAGKQERFTAKIKNTVATIGTAFLPVVSKLADAALALVDGPGFKGVTTWLTQNPGLVLGLVGGLVGLAGTLNVVGAALQAWSTITKIARGVQLAFNLVMAANPIGLLVIAIAALVAGLVWFFTQTELGRDIIANVWSFIQTAIGAVVDWFLNTALPFIKKTWTGILSAFSTGRDKVVAFLKGVWDFIKQVWNYSPLGLIVNNWGKILDFFRGIPGKIGAFFRDAIAWLKQAGLNVIVGLYAGINDSWVGRVVRWFQGIPGAIGGFFSNAGSWLWDAATRIMQGFIDGLAGAWNTVKDWFGSLTSAIPSWKGPEGRDKKLLTKAGTLIMGGLVKGLERGRAGVRKTLGGVTDLIETGLPGTSGSLTLGGVDLSGTAPRVVVVQATVHAPVGSSGVEIGRSLQDYIDQWLRANGGR